MVDSKKRLRKKFSAKLNALSTEQRAKINRDLHAQLFQQTEWKQASTIGVTISLEHEWDTWTIIEQAWQEHKRVVVPKCNPTDKSMTFYQIETKDDLAIQFYNLMEPIETRTIRVNKQAIDLLIVPGVVFDDRHYRIGHGGGYYDRFLADFSANTVSLVWQGQMISKIKNEPFDQPVKQLLVSQQSDD
ncbi:5-formyltetrahydrofolate cyclo-ligase [Amphibacillus indicireducens]|uniref:5-formyltetrahydrofolate cyclo-ligase n=1 Tax=Amphibacillus indicireducens TaxID=1076330 RepID=A0ABP7VFK5_9BACI